jgi:exopolysaccharide production protein ExoZ
MFAAGCMLYDVRAGGFLRRITPGLGFVGLAGAFSVMLLLPFTLPGIAVRTGTVLVFVFILVHGCVINSTVRSDRLFSWTPLRRMGNMSYSFYLIHGLVLNALFLFISLIYPPQGDQTYLFWILMLLFFLAALLPSIGLYLLVEWPFSLMPDRFRRPSGVQSTDRITYE